MKSIDDMTDDEYERWCRFNDDVSAELRKIKIRKAAQERLRREEIAANPAPPFDLGTVADIRKRPAPPPFRADELVPSAAGVLVVAARKTGKTTFELNWARSLLTGQDFLGRFPVRPTDGTVALLNYEVSGDTLALWAEQHHVPADRLFLVNLRGRRNPLAHPDDREHLAAILRDRGTEAVICDPFGRAFTGKSQNDPGEVGAWLTDLDLFARAEVGATDVMLAAHAGWNGERSRGSSALEDWADSIIWLTRDQEDDTKRFLRAEGRDVLIEEDQLTFDEPTRTLALAGTGSRAKARDDQKIVQLAVLVVRAASEHPGISYAAAERHIRDMDDNPGFRNGDVARAARYAREHGRLHIAKGSRGGVALTTIEQVSHLSPTPPGETSSTSPTSPYRGEVEVGVVRELHVSRPHQNPEAAS